MLKISDLTLSKELDSKTMAGVHGGKSLMDPLSLMLDASTTLRNKVADVDQMFALGLAQDNAGAVTNNQSIQGGNGITYAPVTQRLSQDNWLDVYGIGNTTVS